QSAADVALERLHLGAEARALGAAGEMLLERRRGARRCRPDQEPGLGAVHACSSFPLTSGAAAMPHRTRSLLRARNSRVSTALGESASSRAISSVEKPPRTCSTSGSRYSSGNFMIA